MAGKSEDGAARIKEQIAYSKRSGKANPRTQNLSKDIAI
jgi:hypothetical protein